MVELESKSELIDEAVGQIDSAESKSVVTWRDFDANANRLLEALELQKTYEGLIDMSQWIADLRAESLGMKYLPDGIQVGNEGVLWIDKGGVPRHVSSTPYWLERVVQSVDSRESDLQIAWLSHRGKVERTTMPAAYLADKRALTSFLYGHNIAGFSATKQAESNREYLRGSVLKYNRVAPSEDAYNRLGWHGDEFVFGQHLLTKDGCRKANLSRIPSDFRTGLQVKGDANLAWWHATSGSGSALKASEQWQHCFTLLAVLGSPLLRIMGVDGAVLSLAGESGVGKTTAARFALSAFGDPKAFEIAPQSTEKSFYERLRIAQNFPILCNEAATMDIKRLGNIVYGAVNGEARDTLTQKVELRPSNRWALLSVFTSNSHLKGLDERYLNEACRRRILELTVDTPLDQETAVYLNRLSAENFGSVGRDLIEYVIANRATVEKRLNEAFEWVMSHGVKPEDRYSAWLIAAAKVAGEIGDELMFIGFQAGYVCLKVIEAVKSQSEDTKTSDTLVDELIADFINAHNGYFTKFSGGQFNFFDDNGTRGEIVGRINVDPAGNTIAIARKALTNWARERGIDSKQITNYCEKRGVPETSVKFVAAGKATRSIIIADEGDHPGREILRQILENQKSD
jgi:hypothetical protein